MDIKLVRPDIKFKESFLIGLKESHQEGKFLFWDYEIISADFSSFVVNMLEKEKMCPYAKVPESVFWAIKNNYYVGRISLRHHLTNDLKIRGGHIGYDVIPSCRRQGIGTSMLNLGLHEANLLGIHKVLLTTSIDNIGSQKIIEENGGVLEKIVHISNTSVPFKYYWINT